jgi:hypothetical protein
MNVVANRFRFHRIWDWGTKALHSTLSTNETVSAEIGLGENAPICGYGAAYKNDLQSDSQNSG